MISLLLFLLVVVAAGTFAAWVYLRMEPSVRGRRLLAFLRAGVLALVLLLGINPPIPWRGASAAGEWAVLDNSLSMMAVGADGTPLWDGARARARALEDQGLRVETLTGSLSPEAPRSELAPVLRRAAEAGAAGVRVLSDFRLHDPLEVEDLLSQAGLEVSAEPYGAGVSNAGVAELRVDDALGAGDSVRAVAELFASGAGDSVRVEFRREGALLRSRKVAAPGEGRVREVAAWLPGATEAASTTAEEPVGRARYTVRVFAGGDVYPDDDEAVAYALVGGREGGVVLVSFRPDWEPRYLLPVLGAVTGLPTRGYLRLPGGRFAVMGRGGERGAPVDSTVVRREVARADLVVIHGLGGEVDAWEGALLKGARARPAILVWPADEAGARRLGLSVRGGGGGEWYAAPEAPASPVGGALAGTDLRGIPPLEDLLVSDALAGAPLTVQLGGTGPPHPAVTLREEEGRRMAAPLASGFWRWAARPGRPREVYRRLWSGVAGWLLEAPAGRVPATVRPRVWVVPRGEPVAWLLPSGADSVPLRIWREGGSGAQAPAALRGVSPPPVPPESPSARPVVDALLTTRGGRETGVLAPGTYRYEAGEGAWGGGRFDVARATREMLPAPHLPAGFEGEGGRRVTAPARTRPLRDFTWLYLVAMILLLAEWIGR
ncbi:MAG: hypothetical protein ACE5GJ_14790, partial [Gemmatimonadota bacterium]